MMRTLALAVVGAVLLIPPLTGGWPPPSPPPTPGPQPGTNPKASLSAGKWRVEFANEVTEVRNVKQDGTASVLGPVRMTGGKAVVNGGSVVIVFEGGRVQRWTPVGKRFVVEHWFPGSRFPTASPGVLGIADRARCEFAARPSRSSSASS
jgi:hypothetical protein